jgi:hypothetical protein
MVKLKIGKETNATAKHYFNSNYSNIICKKKKEEEEEE